MKNKFNERMEGIYDDFRFVKNYNENYFMKRELTEFYSRSKLYSFGIFHRVVFRTNLYYADKELYRKNLNSLFYLNPNMTKQQVLNIYNTYSKIPMYPTNKEIYIDLWNGRLTINRDDCRRERAKIILNEDLLSNKYRISINDFEFYEKLKLEKKKLARIYIGWLTETKSIEMFFDNIDNVMLSYSYIANEIKNIEMLELKDKYNEKNKEMIENLHSKQLDYETEGKLRIKLENRLNDVILNKTEEIRNRENLTHITKVLNRKGIYIRQKELEFIDNNGLKVIIPRKSTMEYYLEKNIDYFIKENKRKITTDLLLNEVKFYDDINNELITLKKSSLYELFSENKSLKKKVLDYNENFDLGKIKEINLERKMKVINLLNIKDNDLSFLDDSEEDKFWDVW